MTKEIDLTISGIQKYDSHEEDTLKTSAKGEYYFRNDGHYVLYEECTEGFAEPTKSILKLKDGCLEMTRKGLINTKMVFDKRVETVSHYKTPFGEMVLGIRTKSFYVKETEALIQIEIAYSLTTEGTHMADCRLRMEIKSCK